MTSGQWCSETLSSQPNADDAVDYTTIAEVNTLLSGFGPGRRRPPAASTSDSSDDMPDIGPAEN